MHIGEIFSYGNIFHPLTISYILLSIPYFYLWRMSSASWDIAKQNISTHSFDYGYKVEKIADLFLPKWYDYIWVGIKIARVVLMIVIVILVNPILALSLWAITNIVLIIPLPNRSYYKKIFKKKVESMPETHHKRKWMEEMLDNAKF